MLVALLGKNIIIRLEPPRGWAFPFVSSNGDDVYVAATAMPVPTYRRVDSVGRAVPTVDETVTSVDVSVIEVNRAKDSVSTCSGIMCLVPCHVTSVMSLVSNTISHCEFYYRYWRSTHWCLGRLVDVLSMQHLVVRLSRVEMEKYIEEHCFNVRAKDSLLTVSM